MFQLSYQKVSDLYQQEQLIHNQPTRGICMLGRNLKSIAAAGVMAGTLLVFVAPHALAAGDTDDNISPAGRAIVANLKAGTKFTATGAINGIAITVTCTKTTYSGKTPTKGLGPINIPPPVFSGCTDSPLGGTDTVKTTGVWQLTFVDAANDETKDSTADHLIITVPTHGATFTSSRLPTCHVIVAPSGPAKESSTYNDAGTAVASNDPLPVQGQGCSATSPSHVTETLSLSPVIKDVG
jgi:hypothetical protein